MNEHFTRNYLKEEDFLDEFYDLAGKAAALLNDEWCPNESCDDATRQSQRYLLSTDDLPNLIFDSAALYSDINGLSSVKIVLKSSRRVVVVAVKRTGGEFVAEKISDRTEGEKG
jgi:transcriptional regulator with GAF, ATPase, and Fis domain